MSTAPTDGETYNPWTVVNLVFTHLADQGLHPVLGDGGDPAEPARALLTALGIRPAAEGNREVMRQVRAHLAEIRNAVFDQDDAADDTGPAQAPPAAVSRTETWATAAQASDGPRRPTSRGEWT
jgi:hypothetical protein